MQAALPTGGMGIKEWSNIPYFTYFRIKQLLNISRETINME
jgi:hypothetical protein